MKKVIPLLVVCSVMVMLSSCTTYSYTSRSSVINGTTISSRALGVEVVADFSRKVTATSDPQVTQNAAIQDAQFKCLQESNIDVIVDPIYKTQFNMFKKKGFIVTVIGYAGTLKQVPVGIDAMVEQNYSMEDIEKYKLLNDPDFYKYYYQKDNKSGDVTNYYLGGAPVLEKPAKQKFVLPALADKAQKDSEQSNVGETQSEEFSSFNSFKTGPSDKYICSLEFGYISKVNRYDGKKYGYMDSDKKFTPGFRFGLGINPTFKYGLGFKTGLYMDYIHESSMDGHDIALNIPIQVSYRYEFLKNLSAFIYTGPVLDFEVWSAYDYEYYSSYGDHYTDSHADSYSPSKSFDFQWGIGAGLQYKRMRFTIGGEFGMRDWDKKKRQKPIMVSLAIML